MPEQRPCPFCKNATTELRYKSNHRTKEVGLAVVCKSCGAQGPMASTADRAVELWNERIAQELGKVYRIAVIEEDEQKRTLYFSCCGHKHHEAKTQAVQLQQYKHCPECGAQVRPASTSR